MKKTFLTSIILFAFALGGVAQQNNCWDGSIAESYDGGDGTPENPYQIANASQLALLAYETNVLLIENGCYILTDDICIDAQWTPIGCLMEEKQNYFSGHFDGNGKTVSKIYYEPDGTIVDGVIGLFGLTYGAVIVNTHLSECALTGTEYAGGLIGYAGLTDVSDCSIEKSTVVSQNGRAGGLVGYMGKPYYVDELPGNTQKCHINYCRATADVMVDGKRAGGILCESNVELPAVCCEISNCVNYASVSSWEGASGGIGGWLIYTDVMDCVNHGPIDATSSWSYAGGVAGFLSRAGMKNCLNDGSVHSHNLAGGIIGALHVANLVWGFVDTVFYINNCHNYGEVSTSGVGYSGNGTVGGGVIGWKIDDDEMYYVVTNCSNHGSVFVEHGSAAGIIGQTSEPVRIMNVYNVGRISADEDVAGITSNKFYYEPICEVNINLIKNTYNAGELVGGQRTRGSIINWHDLNDTIVDSYWLYNEAYTGSPAGLPLLESCAFNATDLPTQWELDSVRYGTYDLLTALNAGAYAIETMYPEAGVMNRWREDVDMQNGGFPIFDGQQDTLYPLIGTDWYYEIENENGSITYQHLEYASDTTINHKDVKIIIRTNTLYDKDAHQEVTHEYVYQTNNRVYWWNKDLQEFTLLYDFGAEVGDNWVVKVGTESITMHVDSVSEFVYNESPYKSMTVSDEAGVFNGTIVCAVGHLSSFFPERLMRHGNDMRVEGLRCYWLDDELIFKIGEEDCDAIYEELHGVEENAENQFEVYPNPTDGVLFVETHGRASQLPDQTYRITNLMGQTLLTGNITAERQRIDVSALPEGMYFISVGEETRKFVVR